MKRIAALVALLLTASMTRAVEPKVLETNWIWNTYYSSFTSVTSKTIDPAGYGSVGFSSVTANIVGFEYSVYAKGGDANYTITQTTKTPNSATAPTNFNNPSPFGLAGGVVLATSSVVGVPSGLTYNGRFEALTVNPYFTFSGLSSAATYYVWVEYGLQRKP